MQRKKGINILLSFFLIVTCICSGIFTVNVNAATVTNNRESSLAKKTILKNRMVYRNGHYYYYDYQGKLVKNCLYRVNGYVYLFDHFGRRISGKIKDNYGFYSVFSTKTGRRTAKYIYMKIRNVDAKNNWFLCYNYDATPLNRMLFRLSSKDAKIFNEKGKKVKLSSIKKGNIVRVYTTASTVKECYPAFFEPVYKIQLMRHTTKSKK